MNARIQTIAAREKTKERKNDVHKKILIGAYYLDQAKKNNSMDEIKNLMDKFLKCAFDRELFGLEHIPSP